MGKRKPQDTRVDLKEITAKYMAYEPNCSHITITNTEIRLKKSVWADVFELICRFVGKNELFGSIVGVIFKIWLSVGILMI